MTNFTIIIEDIENAPNKIFKIDFEDFIEGIDSKSPIKADLTATILGDFIQIKGNVQGSATLECDLCLKKFEYEFDFEIDELYAKDTLLDENEASGQEIELKDGQFVTDLKGSNTIDISDLLYQSVILDFPNKKVCGITCKGAKFLDEESFSQNQVDPRMAIFKEIKLKKDNN